MTATAHAPGVPVLYGIPADSTAAWEEIADRATDATWAEFEAWQQSGAEYDPDATPESRFDRSDHVNRR